MSEETADPRSGRVVLFNGPPSSGKTSLVAALQQRLAEPWFHLSLDDFHAGYLERWWVADDGPLFDRLVAGYAASLREMAVAGNDVLAEAVITPARRNLYESVFGETPIALIAVRCPLEVAVDRERNRTDRRSGPIEFPPDYFAAVYGGLTYDHEIDTSNRTPDALATDLLESFSQFAPTSFTAHRTH